MKWASPLKSVSLSFRSRDDILESIFKLYKLTKHKVLLLFSAHTMSLRLLSLSTKMTQLQNLQGPVSSSLRIFALCIAYINVKIKSNTVYTLCYQEEFLLPHNRPCLSMR